MCVPVQNSANPNISLVIFTTY
uniref:Uncharacterized protein n=1 Tax=Arundo donax TaxID=35708 RepID=A0A0A9FTR2_ARUDO